MASPAIVRRAGGRVRGQWPATSACDDWGLAMMDGVANPGAPLTPQQKDRRGRLSALWAIALGPDSYGIVFLFLIVDYVFLTVGWTGRLAIIVTAMWLGLTVLLAFRTSEVPHR